eukprot:396829_1
MPKMTSVTPTRREISRETIDLSSPFVLPCGVQLDNRIIKAPMTEQLSDANNDPSDELIALYERWGKGGASVLVTGNIQVDRRFMEGPYNVAIDGQTSRARLREWAERAQKGGARLFAQISHAGRQCPRRVSSCPVAPSPIRLRREVWYWDWIMIASFAAPRELSVEEIWDVVRRFSETAALLKECGFGGIQIHSAHGYLLSSFLSPKVNQRTDEWGGTAEKRRRLLIEVVRAVRQAVGPDFPVVVKLNSADFQRGGFTEDESIKVVRCLGGLAVDFVEISGGNYENPVLMDGLGAARTVRKTTLEREAYYLDYCHKLRDECSVPIMLTGGFRSAEAMTDAVRSRATDLVGLARPFAMEADFAQKILSGKSEKSVVSTLNVAIGVRFFDSLLQNAWYQRQMKLLANGQPTDTGLSYYWTILCAYVSLYLWRPFK